MEFDEIYLRAGFTIPPLTLKSGVLSVVCGKFFNRAYALFNLGRGQIAFGQLVTI